MLSLECALVDESDFGLGEDLVGFAIAPLEVASTRDVDISAVGIGVESAGGVVVGAGEEVADCGGVSPKKARRIASKRSSLERR